MRNRLVNSHYRLHRSEISRQFPYRPTYHTRKPIKGSLYAISVLVNSDTQTSPLTFQYSHIEYADRYSY